MNCYYKLFKAFYTPHINTMQESVDKEAFTKMMNEKIPKK